MSAQDLQMAVPLGVALMDNALTVFDASLSLRPEAEEGVVVDGGEEAEEAVFMVVVVVAATLKILPEKVFHLCGELCL